MQCSSQNGSHKRAPIAPNPVESTLSLSLAGYISERSCPPLPAPPASLLLRSFCVYSCTHLSHYKTHFGCYELLFSIVLFLFLTRLPHPPPPPTSPSPFVVLILILLSFPTFLLIPTPYLFSPPSRLSFSFLSTRYSLRFGR